MPSLIPRCGARYLALLTGFALSFNAQGESSRCAKFNWATDFDGTSKAALLVDVQSPRGTMRMQLDTGSDVSVIYGASHSPGLPAMEEDRIELPLSLGDITLGSQELVVNADIPAGQAAGVLGMKSLLEKVLIIDYPATTICELSAEDHSNFAEEFFYVPARLKSNKLFLFTRLNSESRWGVFFDTGASSFNLLVDHAHWQKLTGRSGKESHNRSIRGYSWGELITLVGAPMLGQLAFGGYVLERPIIHFVKERPKRFAQYPITALGLVGNAPFLETRLLLDLRKSNTRFGIGRPGTGKRL